MPINYPGANATPAQVAAWMGERAAAAGLPRELPVMAGLVESGLRNLPGGDRDSQGFFQMRSGIWNTGAYRGYASNPELQMQWFVDQAKKANRGSNLGEWVANIERPAEQYRGRYQTRLAEAQRLLGAAAGGGTAAGAGAPVAAAMPTSMTPPTTIQPTTTLDGTLGTGRATMLQRMLDQNAELAKIPKLALPEQRTPAALAMPAAPTLPTQQAQQPTGTAPAMGGIQGKLGDFTFDANDARWGGAQVRANAFRDMAKTFGLGVMSEKRDRKLTTSGHPSDHWVGSKNSYAFDLSNGSSPTPEMDQAARYFASLLGVPNWDYGLLNRDVGGYRYQLLYRTNQGGNHYNHIHLGVRRI